MKDNHTPGPWLYETGRFNNPNHDDKSGSILAEVDDWIIAEICGDCINSEANARLIAAAPDLLEALKAVQANDRNGVFLDCDVAKQVKAAITKAEGASV